MTAAIEGLKGARALLRFLQREGRLSADDASRVEELVVQGDSSVNEILEHERVITEKDLSVLLAEKLRLPLIDLAAFPLDLEVTRAVKEGVATKYEVVPLRLDDRVFELATANPLDVDALRAIEFTMGRRVHPSVATRLEIREALAHAYRLEESLEQFLANVPASGEAVTIAELKGPEGDLQSAARDAELPPVVRLADLILVQGIKSGASDVHIEPGPDVVLVRYRIDGVLEEGFRFPKWVQNPLITRFKVLAKLDITERRVPQDGRIQVRHRDNVVDHRVSSLPAQHGEKVTLRILDTKRGLKALDTVGLSAVDLKRVRAAVSRPEGMVLVTGPTGSGKSTTLYACIREIMSPAVNIVTIENPIEYELRGITQVEVNVKQGLTFAGVLRSCLRQDPDVILVGEIRDQETAQIALQAAQTGHLVLSTLHTNDAVATVTRLIDLGIEPYVLASSLNMVVAQRLVRRICPACSVPYEAPEEIRQALRLRADQKGCRRGTGCPACRQTGYSGRIGVHEVLPISPTIAHIIEAGGGESAVRQQARTEGCTTLLEEALAKLAAGVTTPEEVLRVVQVSENEPRCPSCEGEVEEGFTVCPHCSTVLRATCGNCTKPLSPTWVTCPHCGAPARVLGALAGGAAPATGGGRGESRPAAPVRSFKALVVDDDPDLRRIVRLTVEAAGLGLSVITAQDGAEALTLIDIERPDIVILDLAMPGLDGFEVCRQLRAAPPTRHTPVLMLTAKDSADSVAKGFEEGADDYVIKPFRRDDLIARMRRMIERTFGSEAHPLGAPAAPAAQPPAPAERLGVTVH
jgi:type IV pilus assembly protein PilB